MARAKKLGDTKVARPTVTTFGVCAACDPRIDQASRERTVNVIETMAESIAEAVRLPDGTPVHVVWSPVLIDGEKQADIVAKQFRDAGVDAIVCTPDTWAFPQLTLMSLLAHMPADMPVNITVGNSAPKPGVVYAHAVNGALAQAGRLSHLNVGTWPDTGQKPKPTPETIQALADWCYAALTFVGLKGRRVVVFGHDSMGMETALAHVNATRRTFGLEITRLDMKLLADMLNKGAYNAKELKTLRAWLEKNLGKRLDIAQPDADKKLDQSLAMYLIMRDLLADLNAVGGGFMNQLEWGSDPRGIPLPICDMAESLMNTTFDHNGPKPALPFATEADVQGLLTMLFKTWLSGGNPPLFMDFRKVWEPWEIQARAKTLGVSFTKNTVWAQKGLVDGDNSGSASLNWAGKPGESAEIILKKVSMPGAELYYFPGGGNSVTFVSPGGIEGIASRLAYSELTGMFSLIWDEAFTVDLPAKLASAVANSSNVTWPHTWVVPKYAAMSEYKQYAPANHFHMTWNLAPARLQYWMDLTNVLSVAPWQARPCRIEGVDRPLPLMYLINGGENVTKRLRARGA
ncbi:MAG: hypothetical protein JW828_03165 [Sedimentisphaerales bacterium]|nr:hypothetical protein [Sedimentisphaerales bacterium]